MRGQLLRNAMWFYVNRNSGNKIYMNLRKWTVQFLIRKLNYTVTWIFLMTE